MSAEDIKVGDSIVVTIKRIGINGEGVGYYKRKAVFVNDALPGEIVKAKVTKIEPSFLYAALYHIEKKSADRVKPNCPVYEACGGCQLQHVSYEGQLRAKEDLVREAFSRYAGITELPLRPIAGMENPWSYRNKAQLQAGLDKGQLVTGLYSPGSHKLVDIAGCPIQHSTINKVIETAKHLLAQQQIPIYLERKKSGVIRTIVARTAARTGEIQLTFITAAEAFPRKNELIASLRRSLPEVSSIAQNINAKDTPLVFGDKTVILWGKERIEESLGDLTFALSPRAFFQLNPEQTVKLYNYVKEACALTGKELVVDAYCGTGTIALWLAPYAKEVRGIEIIEEAVEDARRNADLNRIKNASFYTGKSEVLLPQWVKKGIAPDVIVVDPPRTGCDPSLLRTIMQVKPERFVYVSCNPSTLAKDCKMLIAGGYQVSWVQPLDMFPQTAHVECVLLTEYVGAKD